MIDNKKLPYLINLLDDEPSEIQDDIIDELVSVGPSLRTEIEKISPSLNSEQIILLRQILDKQNRIWIKEIWPTIFDLREETDQLEAALGLLADYQNDLNPQLQLSYLLNEVTEEFKQKHPNGKELQLAHFLFREKKLSGAQHDYYNPRHSNLVHVINEKQGLPISLACIYILIGRRLKLNIEGCHLPGHFMARVKYRGEDILVDCYNSGHIIEKKRALYIGTASAKMIKAILNEKTDADIIISRVLNNLIQAYQLKEDIQNYDLMEYLLELFDNNMNMRGKHIMMLEDEGEEQPAYFLGQKIYHKKYGYRGIVVDYDMTCQADDEWYNSNQSKPPKDQPWYQVLVHDSDQVTYAAQSNLEEDLSDEKIYNPYVAYFFTLNEDGEYIRNNRPWIE